MYFFHLLQNNYFPQQELNTWVYILHQNYIFKYINTCLTVYKKAKHTLQYKFARFSFLIKTYRGNKIFCIIVINFEKDKTAYHAHGQ